MKMASKSTKREEKIIRDVIKNFGPVIDLNETPFVLIEILRKFGSVMVPDDGGLPPGGVGVGGPSTHQVNNSEILKEILKLSREVSSLKSAIKKLRKAG